MAASPASTDSGPPPGDVPMLWPLRFARTTRTHVQHNHWFVIALYFVAWLTFVVSIAIWQDYEYERFQTAWQLVIPNLRGVAVAVPLVWVLAAFFLTWRGWAAVYGLFVLFVYTLLQIQVTYPGVSWRGLWAVARHDGVAMRVVELVWHVALIPFTFILSLALVGELTGATLRAMSSLRHAWQQGHQQEAFLAAERREAAAERRDQAAVGAQHAALAARARQVDLKTAEFNLALREAELRANKAEAAARFRLRQRLITSLNQDAIDRIAPPAPGSTPDAQS